MKLRAWLATCVVVGIGAGALAFGSGCGGDDGARTADASPTAGADASQVDAALADAHVDAQPDAMSRCGSDFLIEGEFVDWNSTPEMFLGIIGATVVEVGNAMNTASTPPNGRVNLCVTPNTDVELRYSQANYRTIHHSVGGTAAASGVFSARSLTAAQEAQFATDHGVSIAAGAANLLVEVREYPSLAPVLGATVTIGGASPPTVAGTFTQDGTGAWATGNTTTDRAHVLFPGIAATGPMPIAVTGPAGTTCVGRSSVQLVAGEITFTRFACTR